MFVTIFLLHPGSLFRATAGKFVILYIIYRMKPVRLVLLSLYLLLTLPLWSQEIITGEKEFSYSETFTSASDNNAIRSVLLEIARTQGKIGTAMELRYSYVLRQRLVRLDSLHCRVEMELKQVEIAGDVNYRGLDASEVLMPDAFSGQVLVFRVRNTAGNLVKTIIDTLNVNQDPMQNRMGYFSLDPLFFSDTTKNANYELHFVNLHLGFSAKVSTAFNQFSTTCDNYYDALPRIGQLHLKTAAVDIDSVDFIQFSDIELREIETEMKFIESAAYPMKLNLFRYDPAGYTTAIENLRADVSAKRIKLNALLTSVDALFYDKAMKYFLANDYRSAAKYFEKSLVLNPYFAAAEFRLSEMAYRQGLTDSASVLLRKMYDMTFTDPVLENEAGNFCRTTYQALLDEGKTLNNRGEFYEAIVKLEHARLLCEENKTPFCQETGTRMLSESYYGVYESYLTIAGKAIANERYEIAETYILQSIAYQNTHSAFIITSAPSYELLQKLADAYSRAVNQLIGSSRFEQAQAKADRIDSLSIHFPGIRFAVDLKELHYKIKRGVLNEKLDKAVYCIGKKDFPEADKILIETKDFIRMNEMTSDTAQWFSLWVKVKQQEYNSCTEQAWKMARKKGYNNEIYTLLMLPARKLEFSLPIERWDSLLYYAKPFAAVEVYTQWKKALGYINAGDSLMAFSAKNIAESQSELWDMKQSDSVIRYRQDFLQADFLRRCEKHRYWYSLSLERAKEKISDKQFSEAIAMLEDLKKWSLKNIECAIDDKEIYSLITAAKPAAEYMELVGKSLEAARLGTFSVCINSFTEAESLYKRAELSGMGILPLSVSAHFGAVTDDIIVYRAADYMIESRRFEDALAILRILQKRGFSASLTSDLQIKLGRKLAVRDRIADPGMNYKVEVLKYSDGEDYFRTLVKNYYRTWKKISR